MSTLLHIAASPRAEHSESLRIAQVFLDTYRETHPDDEVIEWDLWDGTLPAFGTAAAAAKTAIFMGETPSGEAGASWAAVHETFQRFASADRLLFSVPMWNAGVPYILKQFVDVVSQPGMVYRVDSQQGYEHLLQGQGKRAAVIYTSGVWGPELGPEFGRDFQSTFFNDWLAWTGIDDVSEIRYHPTLTGDASQAHALATATARDIAKTF